MAVGVVGVDTVYQIAANALANPVHRENTDFRIRFGKVAPSSPEVLVASVAGPATLDLSTVPLTDTPVHPGTLSIALDASSAFDEEGQPVFDLWVRDWETFPDWRDRLRDEQSLASVGRIDHLLFMSWQQMDSREVGLCWSFVRFLLERHPTEFMDYLRHYDNAPGKAGGDPRILHRDAWAAAFASEVKELEREWHSWCLAQGRAFPPDELDRM